jgi:acetyl esterase/lipase
MSHLRRFPIPLPSAPIPFRDVRRFPLLAVAGLSAGFSLLAGNASSLVRPDDPRLALFSYDSSRPPVPREAPAPSVGTASTFAIEFDVPGGRMVRGRLVVPPGYVSNKPVVVFVHGDETDATEFLGEAVMLARGGASSFLCDYALPARGLLADPEADRQDLIRAVVDLRRVVDLLLSRREVDPSRIAFVGRGFGARVGAVLAGVEPRFATFCLVSPVPNVGSWAASSLSPEAVRIRSKLGKAGLQQAAEILAPLEADQWLGSAAPASLLIQFGQQDPRQIPGIGRTLESISSLPRTVHGYDCGGLVDVPEASRDRLAWMMETIAISPFLAADFENRTRLRNPFRDPVGMTIAGMKRVDVMKNRIYKRAPTQDLELDVYRPAGLPADRRIPAVILVPGEAPPEMMKEGKDWGICRSYGELLAASGLAAVPINHRSWMRNALAGEAMSDVDDAVRWVREKADELGIDRDRIAVWAFSGATNYSFGPGLRNHPSWLRALVASYGPLRVATPSEVTASRPPGELDDALVELSPATWLRNDPRGFPAMLVVRGAKDQVVNPLIDEFLEEARRNHVPIQLLEHPTGGHAFDVLVPDSATEEIVRKTLEFLKARLLG